VSEPLAELVASALLRSARLASGASQIYPRAVAIRSTTHGAEREPFEAVRIGRAAHTRARTDGELMPGPEFLAWFDPRTREVPDDILEDLQRFVERWQGKVGREQQLAQPFLEDLCVALRTPRPADGALPHEDFQYEKVVRVPDSSRSKRLDLYKREHFVLEAKCGRNHPGEPGTAPVRGSAAYAAYIEGAYNEQARVYASLLPEGRPPVLIVVDIGHCFWIWRLDALGQYPGFHSPQRIQIPLAALADEENARVLWLAFEDPTALDPARYQEKVTNEAARLIARLAAPLQERVDPARVAKFLIQCLFCMFAEDVDLLPTSHFTKMLVRGRERPELFRTMVGELFAHMRDGGVNNWESIRRFNGALFAEPVALELTGPELDLLAKAAGQNWALVEPSIFGTLIEWALDPAKRAQLGAHFTPRAFVERLVRPVVEEPLRREWELSVKPEATALWTTAERKEAADPKAKGVKARNEAVERLDAFRHRLALVKVLDPACGTGNFLYVAYDVLKTLEFEVLALRDSWRPEEAGRLGLARETGAIGVVAPSQLLGIELDPFAAEIAQLTLWIGHLQWELRYRKAADDMPEPIIPTVRTIEARDALVRWTSRTPRLDAAGQPVTRWKMGAVKPASTHEGFVPDESVREPVYDYEGVTQAPWPQAHFIVGNPPFIGNKAMRERLGDGYVDAVRGAYDVPDTVDFVMYWWHRAAEEVRSGRALRFGFITTNSLSQTFNRKAVEPHLTAKSNPLRLMFAVPDHPWHDMTLGADVRISMTAAEAVPPGAGEGVVLQELETEGATAAGLTFRTRKVPVIHSDLRAGVDLTSTRPLWANAGVSFQGMNLVGKGFRLTREEVRELGFDPAALPPVIKPYLNAREMMRGRKDRFVIDAFGWTADDLARQYPTCFQWLLDRVKPERDQNRDQQRKRDWWLFGRSNRDLRATCAALPRFLITPETSKHHPLEWAEAGVVPDHTLYAIALSDDCSSGILSSRLFEWFLLASGGRMGVGNDPRFNNTRCFLPFPFPDATGQQRSRIGDLAARIHTHRRDAATRSPALTLTTVYNLVDARRRGEKLDGTASALHALLATDVLIGLHDELDAAVAGAYGWRWPLDEEDALSQLVALNHERAAEEANGTVRWLRPDRTTAGGSVLPTVEGPADMAAASGALPWPHDKGAQTMQVFAIIDGSPHPVDKKTIASRFAGNRIGARVGAIVKQLVEMGFVVAVEGGFRRASAT
jgi:hypothetical protein